MLSDRQHLSEIPLLFPLVGMVAGIAVCGLVQDVPVWVWLSVVGAGAILGTCLHQPRIVIPFLGAVVGIGAWLVAVPAKVPVGINGEFRGEVSRNVDYGSAQRCVVDIGGGARIAVTVYDYPFLIEKGDIVEFRGFLLPPVRETTVPDENDGSHYALINRISAVCVLPDGGFDIVSDASGLRGWLNRCRDILLDKIRHSGLSQPAAEFLAAVLLGEDNVDDDVRRQFSQAGLSHTLALSGTHVSAIALLLALLLLPVEMAGGRKIRLSLTMLSLWGYALLTGLSPSVVRAVIMASFLLVGRLSGRYSNSFNSLCGAALVILLFQPSALFMPGFQLSFLAVAGILMFMPPIRQWIQDSPWGRRRGVVLIVNSVSLPVAAVLATAPLSAFHFHCFPVWFLVANLPVAALLPLILFGGVVMLLMVVVGLPYGWMAWCVDGLYDLIGSVARFAAGLPGNGYGGELYFSAWLLLSVYAGMVMIWLGWNLRRRIFLFDGVILIITAIVLIPVAVTRFPAGECHSWKINRGVALVCREGKNVFVVTDAAPKYYPEIKEQAEIRLADYLGKRGAAIIDIRGDSLDLGMVVARRNVWRLDGRRVAIVRGDCPRLPDDLEKDDIVVVAAGYKGDIMDVRNVNAESTLVLSPSLPPLRRKRYADELSSVGAPYLLNLPEVESWYNPSRK